MHLIEQHETNSGINIRLKKSISDVLSQGDKQDVLVASEIARLISEHSGISDTNQEFVVPATELGKWSEAAAVAIGIGKNCPFGLDIRIQGILGRPKTKLTTRWLKPGTSVGLTTTPIVRGPKIMHGPTTFRLQSPLPDILNFADEFNSLNDEQAHQQFEIWANIRISLGEENISQVSDHFLRALRILSCDAFTLNVSQDKDGSLQVIPRLLLENRDSDGALERVPALPEKDEFVLASRLDNLPTGTSTFPVSDGVYVVAKPGVVESLRAIREIRKWAPSKRKDAFLKPVATITEVLNELGVDYIAVPFIETDGYSERVLDIGAWSPPVIPWLKLPSQPWLPPEEQGILIGDAELVLNADEIKELDLIVRKAIESGESTVTFKDKVIPATVETISSLEELSNNSHAAVNKPVSEEAQKKEVSALLIRTNFESQDFNIIRTRRRQGEFNLPQALKSQPKEHQLSGIRWLQAHWRTGSKGALLADDMGLGKTYQALAFLAWLKDLMNEGKYPTLPILVVAPVGLLKNWEEEHAIHLMGGGLGDVLRLYGAHLQDIKRGSHRTGTATLDTKKLSSASWVLANYETVSDYQLALGAVHFAAVIFDEAQKIKSPKAQMTHAAKALHSDFNLVITGTPVENRMADFWCLADTAQPYCLGNLKDFSLKYESENSQDAVQSLREEVWQGKTLEEANPKLMLRRLKRDNLRGLPKKEEVFLDKQMPPIQAKRYGEILDRHRNRGESDDKVTMLEVIQHLRQVSLHPALFEKSKSGFDFDESARFQLLFQILDSVKAKQEKVLIFLESLALQEASALPGYLLRRYCMARLPLIINGEVETSERQKRVHEFQYGNGFDVMILSPKAGGVGLTLTAANHVVHLSRWWNPAVEDQCSDRVYRIGQNRDVSIYYLMATYPEQPEYSFDVKLNELMKRKKQLSGQLLTPNFISKDEIKSLII